MIKSMSSGTFYRLPYFQGRGDNALRFCFEPNVSRPFLPLEAKFFDEDRAWNGKLIRNVETELTKYSSGCGGLHEIRRPHHTGL